MLLDSVKVKGSPLAFLVNSASTENVGSLKILAHSMLILIALFPSEAEKLLSVKQSGTSSIVFSQSGKYGNAGHSLPVQEH